MSCPLNRIYWLFELRKSIALNVLADYLLYAVVIVYECNKPHVIAHPLLVERVGVVDCRAVSFGYRHILSPSTIDGITEDVGVKIVGVGRTVGHHLHRDDAVFYEPQLQLAGGVTVDTLYCDGSMEVCQHQLADILFPNNYSRCLRGLWLNLTDASCL